MKKLIFLIIAVVSIIMGYVYKTPLVTYADSILYASPCDIPRTYRIGSIDPKYNMTRDNFIASINQAGSIWSSSTGKNLFAYDPKGNIEINLVYDQRSLLNTQINDLNSKVKEQQSELDPKIADYKRRAGEFRAKINKLNSDIEYWNTKGGAPSEEYNALKNRQNSLEQESISLKNEASSLNQSTDLYNQQVGQLHQTVNTFNAALQYKPEEGEYIYDNGHELINIYFDNSSAELKHTLAHELGHSIGIPHNNNNLSIMFPRTTEATALSADDNAALANVCAKKSVIIENIKKLSLLISRLGLKLKP